MAASTSDSKYNTMTRSIDPDSPTWVPLVLNVILILVSGSVYIYNLPDEPVA